MTDKAPTQAQIQSYINQQQRAIQAENEARVQEFMRRLQLNIEELQIDFGAVIQTHGRFAEAVLSIQAKPLQVIPKVP